jgi:hypothetical protein
MFNRPIEDFGLLEFIQRPGEIVFIPRGWWHVVLTLADDEAPPHASSTLSPMADYSSVKSPQRAECGFTVAVTQNYMSAQAFETSIRRMLQVNEKFAMDWCKRVYSKSGSLRCRQIAQKCLVSSLVNTEKWSCKYYCDCMIQKNSWLS